MNSFCETGDLSEKRVFTTNYMNPIFKSTILGYIFKSGFFNIFLHALRMLEYQRYEAI